MSKTLPAVYFSETWSERETIAQLCKEDKGRAVTVKTAWHHMRIPKDCLESVHLKISSRQIWGKAYAWPQRILTSDPILLRSRAYLGFTVSILTGQYSNRTLKTLAKWTQNLLHADLPPTLRAKKELLSSDDYISIFFNLLCEAVMRNKR